MGVPVRTRHDECRRVARPKICRDTAVGLIEGLSG